MRSEFGNVIKERFSARGAPAVPLDRDLHPAHMDVCERVLRSLSLRMTLLAESSVNKGVCAGIKIFVELGLSPGPVGIQDTVPSTASDGHVDLCPPLFNSGVR